MKKKKTTKVLTISELISRGLPHTASGASSSSSSPNFNNPSTSSSSRILLTPLEYPAILIGTINLPTLALKCPNRTCFQFSQEDDSSSSLCCEMLGLDDVVRVIGQKIRVHAWNFLPSNHCGGGGGGGGGGGFLEIIEWEFLDSSSSSSLGGTSSVLLVSSPSSKCQSRKSYRVHGKLDSLSPIFVVPCAESRANLSNTTNVRGFLVKLLSCQCKECLLNQKQQDSHSFAKPVFVYFCGPAAWSWHSVIVKLIGNVIKLSFLKKKSISISGQSQQLAFLTTENTILTIPPKQVLSKSVPPIAIRGTRAQGQCGTFTGLVIGLYMQGMVVELQDQVWLLLSDELLNPPHGIRVGAVITIRNVHLVNPRFSWAKMLILGSCYTTSITVQSFSPLQTGCLVVSQSHGSLRKFIERLKFPARLWMLLVISCFREKFSGTLSEKEILGGSNHEGLVQKYSSLHLLQSVFQTRNGVFTEFCEHKSSGCHSEPNDGNLRLVVPISTFIHQCELMCGKALLQSENMCPISCQGKSYKQLIRRTFQSKDIGIILVGGLKVSPSSGRLQLFDKTGSIDVIIPDLISSCDPNSIFEVVDYSLTVEGIPKPVNSFELFQDNSLSCRSVFNCPPLARGSNLAFFLHFHLRNATSRNLPFYPSVEYKADSKANENEMFHLIRITHKFSKYKADLPVSRRSRMFVEAIVLPWFVSLDEKEESVHLDKVSKDKLKCMVENFQSPSKRRKVEHQSSLYDEAREDRRCLSSSFSNEISCMATVRGVDHYSLVSSSKYNHKNAIVKANGNCGSNVKFFLELKSESSFMYQSLQIGGYYMIKHNIKDPFCNVKASDHIAGARVILTSTTSMWRLSFPSGVLTDDISTSDPSLQDSLPGNDNVLLKDQAERHLRNTDDSPVPFSDVCLHVSADIIGALSELEKSLIRPATRLEETSKLSCSRMSITPCLSSDLDCLFSKKNLISLRGDVIAVHTFGQGTTNAYLSPEGSGDLSCESSSYCIHVSMGGQTVNVYGILRKSLFPTGFGPGINATFHRIIEMGPPNRFMLTPTSFMEINSMGVDYGAYHKVFSNLGWSSGMHTVATDNMVSSGLNCQLIQQSDGSQIRLRCRVVTLHILVLEKVNLRYDKSKPLPVNIPIAAFVLDDGSCCCRCWANGDRAASLLRLPESVCHFERILEKHGRITVRNRGSMFDSCRQDLAVFVSSNEAMTRSDEDLLKSIILEACLSTVWSIVGGTMSPSEVSLVEKEVQVMNTPPSMPNMYAREVSYVNPVAESRHVIGELI